VGYTRFDSRFFRRKTKKHAPLILIRSRRYIYGPRWILRFDIARSVNRNISLRDNNNQWRRLAVADGGSATLNTKQSSLWVWTKNRNNLTAASNALYALMNRTGRRKKNRSLICPYVHVKTFHAIQKCLEPYVMIGGNCVCPCTTLVW